MQDQSETGILAELSELVAKQRQRNTQNKSYAANEMFHFQGSPECSVLDYWQYMFSQLAGQSSNIAEFLVARALGVVKAENADYWSAYDMSYRGRRIEVKETSYVHPWNRKHVSQIRTFSIAPTNNSYWSAKMNLYPGKKLARQSDVYVFCLNTNQDIQNKDPLNLDDWEFYIVSTYRIDRYAEKNGNPDQKKISLNAVKKLAGRSLNYKEIRSGVDEALISVDRYLEAAFAEREKSEHAQG